VKLASTTGAEDALTLGAAAVTANDNLKFVVADVETVTIASLGKLLSAPLTDSTEVDLDLSGISMTAVGATADVVLTGGVALEITATNADIASIDASARTAGVVQTGRSAETGSTYTGGSGADTFIMMSGSDVLTGGLGSDTLDVDLGAVLGGINVDLSSETNQVASMDGGAISGTVLGFENVDLSGYTGFGAVVQAIKTGSTITGTGSVDRITGGASADTITGGAGADVLSGGGGNDTFIYASSAALIPATANADEVVDTVKGGSGTGDKIVVDGAVSIGGTGSDTLAKVTGVEIFQLDANAADGANDNHSIVIAADARLGSIREFDLSTNLDADADSTLTFTSVTEALTIKGGAGEDTVTGGSGVDVVSGNGGIDTFITSAGADTFNGGDGADIYRIADGDEGGDTFDYVVTADDVIQIVVDDVDADGTADVFDEGAIVFGDTDPTDTAGAVVALAAADYNEIAATGDVADNHVNIITDATGYATVAAALNAIDDGDGSVGENESFIFGFWNSANAAFEVHYVSDSGNAAEDFADVVSENLVTLTGVASDGIAAGVDVGNFAVYSLG
jgi:Ca2+-binding RTX toxin-like protein